MPYVEILSPPAPAAAKAELAQAVTEAIVQGFGVGPATVTTYCLPVPPENYAHAGTSGEAAGPFRVLAKVHAFKRSPDMKRAVAAAMTPALAEAFGVPVSAVAVYFFDRERDEVAHGGKLASD